MTDKAIDPPDARLRIVTLAEHERARRKLLLKKKEVNHLNDAVSAAR